MPKDEKEKQSPIQLSSVEVALFSGERQFVFGLSTDHTPHTITVPKNTDQATINSVQNLNNPNGFVLPGRVNELPTDNSLGIIALRNGERFDIYLPGEDPHQPLNQVTIGRNERGIYYLQVNGSTNELTTSRLVGRNPYPGSVPVPNALPIKVPDATGEISRTQFGITRFMDHQGRVGVAIDNFGVNALRISSPAPTPPQK